jgi:hypothetical protein
MTSREGNTYDNFLAKLGLTNSVKFLMWESPPNDLKELISSDALRVGLS